MFSTLILNTTLSIPPNQIDDNIKQKMLDMLKKTYENKILGKINGYVISVLDIIDTSIKDGIINDINGFITYSIDYITVVFIPEKNETLNVIIHRCDELGIFFRVKELRNVDTIECILPKHFINGTYSDGEWKLENGEKYIVGQMLQMSVLNFQIDTTNILIFLNFI